MAFFLRRMIFVLVVLFLGDFVLVQMSIQIIVSLLILLFLILYKPQKTKFTNNKEILNEFTILLMSCIAMSFTGAETDPEKRAWLGRGLIFISLSNITLHMVGLLIANFFIIKLALRK